MKNILMLCSFVLSLLMVSTIDSQAQQDMKDGSGLATVTVTNTGTAFVTSPASLKSASKTTIVVVVTKTSGTVAGTITVQGSLDGTNFVALNTEETQTALATKTAADASAVYSWRLVGNPYVYYRVTWTGAGTMVATMSAKVLSR
jgi:hypothetical protein